MNTMESAAQQGDIESLYRLIEQNPRVLEEIDSTPFVQTPLHVAACAGHVEFATEIMRLKPSFAWKFNFQGLIPVHLALEHGHTTMVLHLIRMDKELVRAKIRGGLTLLHLASQSGDINLLAQFLQACPDSVRDLTARGEAALHFAVKYGGFEAFEFLLRWLRANTVELKTIVNQRDVEGNTIFHIAATNNDTQATELLIEAMTDIDAANLEGQRAIDMINNQKNRNKSVMWNEMRNAYLIVATLIATTTYQAALSPPGGFHQIDASGTSNTLIHGPSNSSIFYEGKSVMSNYNFLMFSTANMFAFATSIVTIISLMPWSVVWFSMYASSLLLGFSYVIAIIVISPIEYTTVMSSIFCILLPNLVMLWILYFKRQQE